MSARRKKRLRRRDGVIQYYWIGSWKKKLPIRRQIALKRKYLKKKLGKVWATDKIVCVHFDGKKLKSPYITHPHYMSIGGMSHIKNQVVIDRDVKRKNKIPLLVHEMVEQHLRKNKGLEYRHAHAVATAKERDYVKRKNKSWQKYQASVHRTKL